ncbi:MAG: hypothetical protein QG566_456 [Patescibacteria group bacterium]|jgi:prepilin-type N-terminal cleavage/methylation domain-containing protein|nr:hypothetical protein [Patescibacteria group bacterium]
MKNLSKNKGFTRSVKTCEVHSTHALRVSRVSTAGFTLIEILVVVAIVGIISSIVLSVIRVGGDKAADAKIKANLGEALIHAKLYYEKYGYYSNVNQVLVVATTENYFSYSDTLFHYGSPQINDSSEAIYKYMWNAQFAYDPSSVLGSISNTWVVTFGTGAPYDTYKTESYAVAVPLKTQNIISGSSGTDYFCIDSSLEEGKVIDTLTQMTGDGGVGSSPDFNGVASCG